MITTPRYVIDLDKFKSNCQDVMLQFTKEWGSNIKYGYSVKTNRDKELIKYANKILNWNIEVVSSDEYNYVKSLLIDETQIILNGPCKGNMFNSKFVLPNIVNLDNIMEVRLFASIFSNYEGFVGLRVNCNLENKCPNETTAGQEVSRFGIDAESHDFLDAIVILKKAGIDNLGIHLHTSTKTRSEKVFMELSREAVKLKKISGVDFSFIDIGGGFFGGQVVEGKPTMEKYAVSICNILKDEFDPSKTMLVLEPGASVLATCVSYETKIINKRVIRGVEVFTVDGTLLHINPFMSNRNQPFEIVNLDGIRNKIDKQIIGGATCMENDRLATITNDEQLFVGDVLSFKNVGAYTMGFNSYFIINPPKVKYIGGIDSEYFNNICR